MRYSGSTLGQVVVRSSQPGFVLSIRAIFFRLLHPFNCFSLRIASRATPPV
jgi:hypothetical protein